MSVGVCFGLGNDGAIVLRMIGLLAAAKVQVVEVKKMTREKVVLLDFGRRLP